MKGLVCPVSFRDINENVSRFSVFLIALGAEIFLLTGEIYIMVFIAFDYLFRIFEKVSHSPLTLISKILFYILRVPKKMINKGPKVFASRMGLLFTLISVGFYFFIPEVSFIFGGIVLLCTFLDSVFNVCFGCLLYHYLIFPIYGDKG